MQLTITDLIDQLESQSIVSIQITGDSMDALLSRVPSQCVIEALCDCETPAEMIITDMKHKRGR